MERLTLLDPQEQILEKEPSALDGALSHHIPPGATVEEAVSVLAELDGRERENALKWLNTHLGAAFTSQVHNALDSEYEGNISERERDMGMAMATHADLQLGLEPGPSMSERDEPSMAAGAQQVSTEHQGAATSQYTPSQGHSTWRSDPVLGPVGFSMGMEGGLDGLVDANSVTLSTGAGVDVQVGQTTWTLQQIHIDRRTGAITLQSDTPLSAWDHELLVELLQSALREPPPELGLDEQVLEVLREVSQRWERQRQTLDDELLEKEPEKEQQDEEPSQTGGRGSTRQVGGEVKGSGALITAWRPEEGVALQILSSDRLKLLRAPDGVLLVARRGLWLVVEGASWAAKLCVARVIYDARSGRLAAHLDGEVSQAVRDALAALLLHRVMPHTPGWGEQGAFALYDSPEQRLELPGAGRLTLLTDAERTMITAQPPLTWESADERASISRIHHLRAAQSVVVNTDSPAAGPLQSAVIGALQRSPGWAMGGDPGELEVVLAERSAL
ncbi:MAG: hypothetical protein CMH57_05065 [Myxococcales bacterium]|nr:hypothetical protein [Myxococcales bacterium]